MFRANVDGLHETFARDAGVLVDKGYKFKAAGIMNMFAQTSHVESIGVFEL